MIKSERTLEELINQFDFSEPKKDETPRRMAVTIWLTPDYHKKYEALQTRHKKKFCRLIKELTEMVIDKKLEAS